MHYILSLYLCHAGDFWSTGTMLGHLCMGGRVPAQPKCTHSCKNSKFCAARCTDLCWTAANTAVQSAAPCVKRVAVCFASQLVCASLYQLVPGARLVLPAGGI